jgi:hypothetical protein
MLSLRTTWASSRLEKSTPVIDYGAQDFCFCFCVAPHHSHNPQLSAARRCWLVFGFLISAPRCFSIRQD